MKKILLLSGIVSLVSSFGMAAVDVTESCQKINQACNAAGYQMGITTKKGHRVFKDCVQPILDGKGAAGVTIDPAIVADCVSRGGVNPQAKKKK